MPSVLAALSVMIAATLTSHPAPVFDAGLARNIDLVLSADSLEGRKTGQPGGHKAEEFAANRFREWGLRPGVGDTSFFQPYHFLCAQVSGPPTLRYPGAPPGPITYDYGNDYVVCLYSGSGSASADVVYVGYGITSSEKSHDDYAGVDVRGKIVMALRGAPHDGKEWSEERAMGYKSRNALKHGAAGILLFENEAPLLGTLQEKNFEENLPVVFVAARVVRDLLQGTGRSLDELKTAAGLGRTVSFSTGHSLDLAVKSDVQKQALGRNVVAKVGGTDPSLRKECVVLGAHLDHLGRDGLGRVYPGADDNGSGASTLLAIAREVARSGWKPRRTLYLVLFTCEEQGLQGSNWFAEHAPPESIAVMLNMDMVGVGDPYPNLGGIDRYPELVRMARALLPDSVRAQSEAFGTDGNSDHFPFAERGIPSLFTVTHGSHPYYHQQEDKSWRIQPEVMAGAGQFELRALEACADTSLFKVDAHRMARLLARMARPLARVKFDEHRHGLRDAAGRGAGVILLELPPAEPLLLSARVSRLEQEFAVDSSLFRIARAPGDLADQAAHGKVSVILEAAVGAFDLADSSLISFLKLIGVRAVVPAAAPTPAEARLLVSSGMLLDQAPLRAPLVSEIASLYSGRLPPGATHGFEFNGPGEARSDFSRNGFLMGEDPVKAAAKLLQKKWSREATLAWLGGSFARFWREMQ